MMHRGRARKTSVTAGTNHAPHADPVEHVVCRESAWRPRSRTDALPQNLHDVLGLGSYETGRAWLPMLRRAMVCPFRELVAALVDVDEAFIIDRATGRQRASTEKDRVMIAVANLGTQGVRKIRLGLVRLAVAHAFSSKSACRLRPGHCRTGLTDPHRHRTHVPRSGPGVLQPSVRPLLQVIRTRSSSPWLGLTECHRCSNGGTRATITIASHARSCCTTSTRSRSASIQSDQYARGMIFYRLLQQSVNTDPHPLVELIGGIAANHRTGALDVDPLPSSTVGQFPSLSPLKQISIDVRSYVKATTRLRQDVPLRIFAYEYS